MREGQAMRWQQLPLDVTPVLPGALPVLAGSREERGLPDRLLKLRVAEGLVVGRRVRRHAEFFAGPGAEVDALAARAAERAVRLLGA